jgi:MFS family permease
MGMMMGAPINYLVINEVDGGQRGVALGVLNVFRMVGTIVGPTIAGSILASAESQLPLAIEKTLAGKAGEMGELTRVAKMVSEQGLSFGGRISPDWLNGLTPELEAALHSAISGTMVEGFRQVYLFLGVITLAAALAALLLKDREREQTSS